MPELLGGKVQRRGATHNLTLKFGLRELLYLLLLLPLLVIHLFHIATLVAGAFHCQGETCEGCFFGVYSSQIYWPAYGVYFATRVMIMTSREGNVGVHVVLSLSHISIGRSLSELGKKERKKERRFKKIEQQQLS